MKGSREVTEKIRKSIRMLGVFVLVASVSVRSAFADEIYEPGIGDAAEDQPWIVILAIGIIVIAAVLLIAAKRRKRNRK